MIILKSHNLVTFSGFLVFPLVLNEAYHHILSRSYLGGGKSSRGWMAHGMTSEGFMVKFLSMSTVIEDYHWHYLTVQGKWAQLAVEMCFQCKIHWLSLYQLVLGGNPKHWCGTVMNCAQPSHGLSGLEQGYSVRPVMFPLLSVLLFCRQMIPARCMHTLACSCRNTDSSSPRSRPNYSLGTALLIEA